MVQIGLFVNHIKSVQTIPDILCQTLQKIDFALYIILPHERISNPR